MTLSAALIAVLSAFPTPGQPADTIPRLLQTALHLDLRVDYEAGTVGGIASLTVRNTGEASITTIPLQIGRLMRVETVSDGAGPELSFTQDVIQFSDWPSFQVNQVVVALPGQLAPGAERTVAVSYGGVLVGYAETGMRYVRDHVDREFTILRTDALAFPSIGVPSIAGLRALPRANFEFSARITIPKELVVAAAVSPSGRKELGGEATWEFAGTEPVPFVNIAIAPYETLEADGVRIFHFAEDAEGAERLKRRVIQTMDAYGTWFHAEKPEGAVTIIEIPEGWGSQASLAGGIIQTADAFRTIGAMSQLYHEIAHLWHPPDTDVPSDRWNEGFATYLAMRLEAELDSGSDLASSMDALAERQRGRAGSSPIPLSQYGENNLTDLSYGTGALMFYMLQESLGPALSDATLGAYISSFRLTGSSTQEFVESVAAANPSVAAAVFDEWLYTTRWLDRLNSGESLADLIESYRLGR